MRKKREQENVEVNLTPMIDLMSVLVAFLLVTAVWLHISAIQSQVEAKGRNPATITPKQNHRVEVHVSKAGYRIQWPALIKKRKHLATFVRGYQKEKLTSLMTSATKVGKTLTASVSGDNWVEYGVVAEAIDAVKYGGIKEVALATN